MPSASLLRRLTFGVSALGTAFVATAGLTAPAEAVVHGGRPASAHREHPAAATAEHHLAALRPAAPLRQAGRARHVGRAASTAAPTVSALVPAQGAPGWPVTVDGTGFRKVTSVTFGGVSATFTVSSATRIRATVPAGAKTGRVRVTTKAGRGRGPRFTVTPAQTLEPGETLPSTAALQSRDGHFRLTMQRNGNLVYAVAGTGRTLWASGTAGNRGAYVSMLSNGNLVLYGASGTTTLWSTKTSGAGPARLVARTNGNLVVAHHSTAAWASGSYDNTLSPGEVLRPGWFLTSGNGYKLTMQRNGDLVEDGPAGAVWSSATAGHPGASLRMQVNGNLVVRGSTRLWSSKTPGHPGARLVDQRSGILAVRHHGHALWVSKKAPAAALTLGKWAGKAGPRAAGKYYGYPYPSPPACTAGGACQADKWAFYRGQCTSWVAYRLSKLNGISFTNFYGGHGRWGNAINWSPQAKALKIAVNARPAVGSIAWYGPTKAAPDGHVAYVEAVSSPTSIVMSEMNYDSGNGFWVHTITKATGDWPSAFIHVADR